MEIRKLDERLTIEQDKKLKRDSIYFKKLIVELRKRDLSREIVDEVSQSIEQINSFSGSNRALRKQIQKSASKILTLLKKKLKLVPKSFYMIRGMILGISFGVFWGVVFGVSFGHIEFLGMGIPIGMVIGMTIGLGLDQKALKEGRQLDLDMKF